MGWGAVVTTGGVSSDVAEEVTARFDGTLSSVTDACLTAALFLDCLSVVTEHRCAGQPG